MKTGLRALVLLLLAAPLAQAGDWPQWLGPRRDGSTTQTVRPWKDQLKVVWRQPVGEGHSSPVVAGGKVYLHTRVKDKNEEALSAFDAQTGKPLWSTDYPRAPFGTPFGSGPRATPAVADGKVYTFGITGVLTCFDADGGKKLWQVETLKKFEATNLFFGASCSPLVDDENVYINVGGKGASVVAFNRTNGETRWKALDDKATYSSGIALEQAGQRAIVFLTAKGLVALTPKDGTVLWQHPLVDKLAESSTTPVVIGDLLFGSSITFGGLALRLETKDGKPAVKEAWMKPEYNCYFSTPVAVGTEHLYLVTGTKPPAFTTKATLRCVEAKTGQELWQRDSVGKYHASLTRTGDGKLLLLEEAGNLVLLDPSPVAYRELARSRICGNTWAHPAIADGRLYIRDGKELVCVQLGE